MKFRKQFAITGRKENEMTPVVAFLCARRDEVIESGGKAFEFEIHFDMTGVEPVRTRKAAGTESTGSRRTAS